MTPDQRAKANDVLTFSVTAEGGIGDAHDGEGLTHFGQTDRWLQEFDLPVPYNTAQAVENWMVWLERTGLIWVCDVPDIAAIAIVDWAINSGHRPAIVALQLALGVAADGIIGPVTRGALSQCHRERLARQMLAAQIRFRGAIITANPEKHAKFARGWAARDAAKIERL